MSFLPFLHASEFTAADNRNKFDALRENSSGNAVAELQYETTGLGQTRASTPLYFPVTFRKTPHVNTASSVINNPDSVHWNDPVGSQGVTSFILDGDGHFIGANVWVRVDAWRTQAGADAKTAIPAFKTMHYFTFTALGVKTLGLAIADTSLPPRTTGLISQLAQEWESGLSYVTGDVVTFKNRYYTAVASSVGAQPGSGAGTWKSGWTDNG